MTTVSLPVRGSALEVGLDIRLAPGPAGTLIVLVPRPDGSSLLARLDATGVPTKGWPVVVGGATECRPPLVLEDGSVRVVCRPPDLNQELNTGTRISAFDAGGRPLGGWPVDVDGLVLDARVVEGSLTVITQQSLGDAIEAGMPTHDVGLITLAAAGRVVRGTRLSLVDRDSEGWGIGPDGIAYGVGFSLGSTEVSQITALDLRGPRSGWPIAVNGLASGPTFDPEGRVVLTVGSLTQSATRVLRFDPVASVPSSSSGLPTALAEFGDTGGCGLGNPRAPIVAADGTIFVVSWTDDKVYALGTTLDEVPGWPYEAPSPLMRLDPRLVREDAYCPELSVPAAGQGGTLYVALAARDRTVGGNIVAVGRDGQLRRGWPVELRRAGSEFWSAVVGADGMAFALAIEPESGSTSSATILSLRPDSTVAYAATIIEP